MIIRVSNKIYIKDPPRGFESFLKKNYVIPNPEYITRVRLNKWIGKTPKTLSLYSVKDGVIILPYGCLRAVYIYIINCVDMTTVDIKTFLNRDATADWSGNDIIPRPYQNTAINAMLYHKFGILKAPCSSGKTIMGHVLAQRAGMNTLWLTHTQKLLEQSRTVGEQILGKLDGRVGTVTDGKVNWGSTITYATVQTMIKLDPSEYRDRFNCVIVDECHRCNTKKATSQMSYVVNNIAAEYKYGLSATPETLDGYGRTVFCNLGDVKYEIKKEELEDQNTIMPVDIYPIFTEWTYPEEAFRANGTLDFHEAVRYMAADPIRNKEITDLICGRPTLILSNNIDHLCYMANTLSEDQQERACLVSTKHDENILKVKILCKHTPKATTEYIDKMRSGELDIMFATYQLAKEGLNIPRLEQVIMAFPAVDDNIITQTVGRVARTCEGKFTARCYDIVDRPTYFRKKWRDRKKLYRKNGNEIIDG